ncbi:hypothetical protein HBB16_07745 [Pseudonocardia sp. MCCB 268]|nr:hypothetical protein [Pseudonocardia cytotoxica]
MASGQAQLTRAGSRTAPPCTWSSGRANAAGTQAGWPHRRVDQRNSGPGLALAGIAFGHPSPGVDPGMEP